MSNISVPAQNTLADYAQKTFLSNDEVAGTNSLRWKNPNGFSASWAVQVGDTGNEQTEVVLLGTATPSGTAGTLTSNTLYPHPADTPLYAIQYNQVVFERSITGTTGTGTILSSGTVTYSPDNLETRFQDTSGSNSYAYKVFFRNSVTGGTTDESDFWLPSGFTFYSLAKLRQRIKDKLWNSDYITTNVIDDWINECKDQMVNEVIRVNEDFAMGTVDVAFGSGGLGTITTTDFMSVRRFDVTYNGADFFKATHQYENSYFPDQVYSSTHPYYNYLGNNIFRVKPEESGGTARLSFYRFGTTMVNDTDELPIPMRSFTDVFVDYGLAQALFKDQHWDQANQKNALYLKGKDDFVTKIVPRDRNTPSYVQMLEAGSGDSYPII